MSLKWLIMSKHMPFTPVCLSNFVRGWTQSANAFSCTLKEGGCLKADHWQECLNFESRCRVFFSEKKSLLAAHFSDKEWVTKLAYLCYIFNLSNERNLSLQGKLTTVFKLHSRDIWHASNIFGAFGRDWAWSIILLAGARSPVFTFESVWSLLPDHKRPTDGEKMDPRPICRQTWWIEPVRARRGSTAGRRRTSQFEPPA